MKGKTFFLSHIYSSLCATFRLVSFFLFYLGNLRWKWINPAKEAEKSINICSKHVHQIYGIGIWCTVGGLFLLFYVFRCSNDRAMKVIRTMKPSICLNEFSALFFLVLFAIQQHSDFFSEYGINRDYQMENTVLFRVFLVFFFFSKKTKKKKMWTAKNRKTSC